MNSTTPHTPEKLFNPHDYTRYYEIPSDIREEYRRTPDGGFIGKIATLDVVAAETEAHLMEELGQQNADDPEKLAYLMQVVSQSTPVRPHRTEVEDNFIAPHYAIDERKRVDGLEEKLQWAQLIWENPEAREAGMTPEYCVQKQERIHALHRYAHELESWGEQVFDPGFGYTSLSDGSRQMDELAGNRWISYESNDEINQSVKRLYEHPETTLGDIRDAYQEAFNDGAAKMEVQAAEAEIELDAIRNGAWTQPTEDQ